jgi:hypothetical protein
MKWVLDKSTSKEESTTSAIPAKKKLKAELALCNRVTCGETYYDFLASDDELPGPDKDGEEVVVLMEDQLQAHNGAKAEMEVKKMLSNWTGMKVKWQELYPQSNLPAKPNLMDLMQLDIGVLYKKLEHDDKGQHLYGFLPRMASCLEAQLRVLWNASSPKGSLFVPMPTLFCWMRRFQCWSFYA